VAVTAGRRVTQHVQKERKKEGNIEKRDSKRQQRKEKKRGGRTLRE
jgi:hypothetical protein